MPTKTCNICNLTLDISNFGKTKKWYRNKCKQCRKNESKCEHGQLKHRCIEGNCNGNSICEHGRRKANCIEGDCNGSSICEHGRIKYECNEGDCNGSRICKHGRIKRYCIEGDCNGSSICEHGSRKYDCPECYPKILCKHDKRKQNCRECSPQNFCKHDTRKSDCPECNPKILCEHGQRKSRCPKCDGSQLCIHCKHIRGKPRYVKSLDKKVRCCSGCFYYYYPNDEIPRRFKCKQHYFNEKLIEEFGVNFFQYDKKIKCGCSGRMPDWFIDCYKYSIIIELDEDQHKYESCDEKRMMELFTDLGNRPLVLIRINPDKYKGRTKKRKGCFDFDEKNILICNEKRFNKRFNILVEMIKYFIDNEPEKEFTMEKLFFDRK